MKNALVLASFLSVALSSFSVAQDIIEGDLPPGKPFDGTSDRASMFDLYQIANAVLASPANSLRLSDEEFSDSLQNKLSARGFPGARIVISPESEPLDRSCSEDETVEVRVSRSVADVVVVGAHWFSRGEPGSSSSGSEKIFAEACLRHPAGPSLQRQSNVPARPKFDHRNRGEQLH